jgi:hypothetical protein
MATELTLSVTEAASGLVATGVLVATIVTAIVRRLAATNANVDARIDALREADTKAKAEIFSVIDRHKIEHRTEFNKVWDRFDALAGTSASQRELQAVERKVEIQYERIDSKLDRIFEIMPHIAAHEARIKNLENVMKGE